MTDLHFDIFNRVGDFLGVLSDEPVEIQEYEEYPLYFKLQSEIDSASVALEIEGQRLQQRGSVFSYGSSTTTRGRRGELLVRVYHQRHQVATYYLQLTGTKLSDAEYHYLVRDLHSLVSLISTDDTGVRGTDLIWEYLTLYDNRFTAIGEILDILKLRLAEIERRPQRSVSKQYHLERDAKPRRVDARTLRWQSTRGAQEDGRVLTYNNVLRTDVYENQFVAYLLTQLQHYLSTSVVRFEHTVDQKIEDVKKRIADWNAYQEIEGEGAPKRLQFKRQQLKKLQALCAKLVKIKRLKVPRYTNIAQAYQQQIASLQQTTFLADVRVPVPFLLKPTLILGKDPAYNAVYQCYQQLDAALGLEEHERLATLLDRVPIERTSKLYEYWVFLQVYVELKRMGFQDAPDSDGIWSIIDPTTFRLRPDSCMHLVGDPELYRATHGSDKTIDVYLRYEHRIGKKGSLCPDIFVEFIRGTTRILILDAKYRDYQRQGYATYEHDLKGVAASKYLKLMQQVGKDGEWIMMDDLDYLRKQIAASFIIHSHAGDRRYIDYGSSGNRNQYGALPLVPTEQQLDQTHLKRLLTMFMRMHLRVFDVCWSQKHDRPAKANPLRQLGGERRESWEQEYCCPIASCENRWWVNHCGRWCEGSEINVPKITFSDPSDNFFDFDDAYKGPKRLLKCSFCNESYLKQ